MDAKRKEQIWETAIKVIGILILLACDVFFIGVLVAAIVNFSWDSIVLILFCSIVLIGGNAAPLMLFFSKGRESFWKTIIQANNADDYKNIEEQE